MTDIPQEVIDSFNHSKQYFGNQLQEFQFYDKYSRWRHDLGRRETWNEAIDRSVAYLRELSQNKLPEYDYERIRDGMLRMGVFPSMRLFAMAGDAARRQNLSIYNCAYCAIDSIDSIVEILNISMSGSGGGYSVESQYVGKLPKVQEQCGFVDSYLIPDTTEGWYDAFRYGLESWWNGEDVEFDYSQIRPAGAILKVKGGRASGPQPLRELLDFSRKTILNAQGRNLRPIEVHDIVTMIGSCAVSGGSRRSAMLSLIDFDDNEMKAAKQGEFWLESPQRVNANNSAVWPDRHLSYDEVRDFILEMDKGKAGEPGAFRRSNANIKKPDRRKHYDHFGTNPLNVAA